MRGADGQLLHAWRAGRASVNAFLDDYAFLICGLIDLYETTFDPRLVESARALAEEMIGRFHDPERGGFFSTDGQDPTVIARVKEYHDGSIPSGNSGAAWALLRLAALLGRDEWREIAHKTFAAAASQLNEQPMGHLGMVGALAFDIAPPFEIAIAGDLQDEATMEMIQAMWRKYLPARVLAAGKADGVDLLRNRPAIGGKPTVYVCHGGTCREPVTTVAAFKSLII